MSPRNARNTSHGGRFYVWGRGERYWSVTTILKALPKDALKFWAARMVAEFAYDRSKTWFTMSRPEAIQWLKTEPLRYTKDAADFGNAIHAAAEAYSIGKPMKGDFIPEEMTAIGHFLDYVDTVKPRFWASEASVYNRTQKYAGTLDSIVEIEMSTLLEIWPAALIPWEPKTGRTFVRLLGDYKTGGDIDEGKGVYPEVALQLNAYANAEFIGMPNGLEEPLPDLDGAFVLQVNEGGWRIVPVVLDPAVFRSFLYVREVFRWIEEISKEVLGTELLPRTEARAPRNPQPSTSDPRSTPPPYVAPEPPQADDTAPPPRRRRAINR